MFRIIPTGMIRTFIKKQIMKGIETMKNKFLLMLISCIMVLALASCSETDTTSSADTTAAPTSEATSAPSTQTTPEVAAVPTENKIFFEIEMQDGGIMKGELYPDVAPITVANFTKLCSEGFYDGLIFHRVIPGFMIQGGGYDATNRPKEAATIKGEFSTNGVENNLKHTRGVISMARTNVYDSASSQFFIMHEDYPSLDGGYAAFGLITEGLDVVDKIATTPKTTMSAMFADYPTAPQVIKTIRIVE